jgi:hypothetical protein
VLTPSSQKSSNGFAKNVPPPSGSPPKPIDHPTATYRMPTTAAAMNDIIIMFSTDFERDIPP